MTAPLEEVLTEEHVKGKDMVNTEFMLTLVVVRHPPTHPPTHPTFSSLLLLNPLTHPLLQHLIRTASFSSIFLSTTHPPIQKQVVPKNLESEWLQTYTTIGGDIAAYNNPDWASGLKIRLDEGKVGEWVGGWVRVG